MTFSQASLLHKLAALGKEASPAKRYVVAFSGGLDSTVLLHSLAGAVDVPLLAVHVDHGLQPDSANWSARCAAIAESLRVEFRAERVSLEPSPEQGVEAAAREARYAVFAALLREADWLLSGHHQDDQAETVLLNLLRGSGPAGLAGIAAIRPFAAGFLARPLLSFARSELQAYAEAQGLAWIEDPSNQDRRFDRNYLRHEILPTLEARWPEAAKTLRRSSGHAGDAAALLDDLAAIDMAGLGARCDRLRIDALLALPAARQRNVLRYAIRQSNLPPPSAAHLQRVLDEVVMARPDAEPVVRWPGTEVRRYRNALYLLPAASAERLDDVRATVRGERIELAPGMGCLRLEQNAAAGLSAALLAQGLELRYRQGGEKFQPAGQSHTKKLKKLLQEAGIVPWMRDRIPLLYAGDELVAVADLWLAAAAVSKPGVAVHWDDRPAIL